MDGCALFHIRTQARTRVLMEMSDIRLRKNEVSGYSYNNANTLITQIERFLERQLVEHFADGMKGLASDVRNVLNEYNLTVYIKKGDVLVESSAASKHASTDKSTLKTAQDKADRQNVFHLAAIGVR